VFKHGSPGLYGGLRFLTLAGNAMIAVGASSPLSASGFKLCFSAIRTVIA
jgi:hypothetical protein